MDHILKNLEFAVALPLAAQVECQPGQIASKTLIQNASVGITLFAFDANEEISAHTSTGDAMVLVLEGSAPCQPVAWIVDEASLLSARDTARLFDLAEQHDARVILVGDVKQLGSVEAGAAFAQLQTAGMETATLGEIVR